MEILPLLIVMRRELQLLTKAVAQISKTHAQRLIEEWNKKAQVLKMLGISTRTLDKLTSSGKLPVSKVNGLIYIKTTDIEKLLNENYVDHSSINQPSNFNPISNDWK